MIRKFFLATLCACAVVPALAQTSNTEERVEYSTDKYKVETNRFWSNWFISVGGGAQVYFGDHDKQIDLKKRIAPALDVSFGKWFTPGVGLRVMYSGLSQKGATRWNTAHSTGENVPGWNDGMQYSKFKYGNWHADMLFNFTNLFCGYKQRVYNCVPYAGIGWARNYNAPHAREVTAHVGVLNVFRLCDALDLNLDIRSNYVNDRFDGEEGHRFCEGFLGATVGLAYKFPRRDWDRSKTVYRTTYNYGDLEAMRQKLNDMSAENERLKQALAEGKEREARGIVKKIAAANLVTFPINKTKLSNEARANLGLLAQIIKEGEPEAVYTITGYADAGTGSSKGNERLSKERAENVYDCLVNEFGVNEKQLRIDYKGGVDNMFYNDPRLSRAVITRGE